MPLIVPERSDEPSEAVPEPPSLDAQEARSMVPTAAIAAMLPGRLKFTEVPFRECGGCVQGPVRPAA